MDTCQPQGTPKRWEAVAGFVRTRTLEEVLLMVKDRQGASATRMKAQEDWKGAQKNPAAVRAQADTRAQVGAGRDRGAGREAVRARVRGLGTGRGRV